MTILSYPGQPCPVRRAVLPRLLVLVMLLPAACGDAFGQLAETRHFSADSGLCSQTIILDSTGLFFRERGCEGTALVSVGRYTRGKGGRLQFRFLPFDSLPPVGSMVRDHILMEYDSLVTLTFYDRYRRPLAYTGLRGVDREGNLHPLETDAYGQVEVNRFVYNSIFLEQLLSLYGTAHGIDLGRESIRVYLNLPRMFLRPAERTVEKPQRLVLQLRKDGLYLPNSGVAAYKLR